MSVVKTLFTLAFVSMLGVGAYAYWLHGKYVGSLDSVDRERAQLARTVTELETCAHGRESERTEADKRNAEATSNLKGSMEELEALRAQRAEIDKRLEAFRALTEKFRKMIDSGKLQVTLRHGRMVVKLPAGILFASGSAELSKEGQTALSEVAAILKQMPDRKFMIAGHTDNVPVVQPSPFKNNLQLSTARAETVTEQLIAAGMSPSRLAAAGYSEYEPVRDNNHEAGRQENRRIEIVLLPNLAELPPMPNDITAPATSAKAAASAAPSGSASSAPPAQSAPSP